ncbi:MAG: hypothetical protein ABSF34_08035 [Verrucomicrobiota bacterium]
MWQIEATQQWERDRKWYEKKRPLELAAVLHNLKRYVLQLDSAPNPKAFTAGYMHHEPHGVVALDQKGGGPNLQETRLYVFPNEERKMLYIITIGNKDDQASDIQFCSEFVESFEKNG